MKLPLGIRILSLFYLLFFYLFVISPLSATATTSAANNFTAESMKEANQILNAASNATAHATGELMDRADNVLSLASDAASNATRAAMNNTMNMLSNVSSNVSETLSIVSESLSNTSTNEAATVNDEANELINAASNAPETTMNKTTNLLNNISGDASLDTQNQTPNSVQSGLINYTSSLYQIQFQYPSSWELNEKKSRFDEGTDISISSYSPSAYIYVQFLNASAVEGMDFQMAVYEFFKSSIDSDYGKEYKVIEQPSFTSIGNHKAGTYLFTHKDKYEDYATRWASQHWIVYVGNHGYLLSFMASTNQFDSPELTQIRNQFLKSIGFLGDTDQKNSIVPNRFG
jgi:hypothetical protein